MWRNFCEYGGGQRTNTPVRRAASTKQNSFFAVIREWKLNTPGPKQSTFEASLQTPGCFLWILIVCCSLPLRQISFGSPSGHHHQRGFHLLLIWGIQIKMHAGNGDASNRPSGKSFDQPGGKRGWLVSGLALLSRWECLRSAGRVLACHKILLSPQENLNDVQWEKPAGSRQAVTGWGTGTSGLCGPSDLALANARSWILSQFLEVQLCSAENFSESLD